MHSSTNHCGKPMNGVGVSLQESMVLITEISHLAGIIAEKKGRNKYHNSIRSSARSFESNNWYFFIREVGREPLGIVYMRSHESQNTTVTDGSPFGKESVEEKYNHDGGYTLVSLMVDSCSHLDST
jgi:hypothetical protein